MPKKPPEKNLTRTPEKPFRKNLIRTRAQERRITQLVRTHHDLIDGAASVFRRNALVLGIPFQEIVQEARIAFVESALPHYEETRKYFAAYANTVIKNHLIDFFRKQGFSRTRVFRKRALELYELKKSDPAAFESALKRTNKQAIAFFESNKSDEDARRMALEIKEAKNKVFPKYLHSKISREGTATFLDVLTKDLDVAVRRNFEREKVFAVVEQALSALNEKQETVIRLRYFVDEPVSMDEISKSLGVTVARVSQLEKEALTILRKRLAREFPEEAKTRKSVKKQAYAEEKIELLHSLGVASEIIEEIKPRLSHKTVSGPHIVLTYSVLKKFVPLLQREGLSHLIPKIVNDDVRVSERVFLKRIRKR